MGVIKEKVAFHTLGCKLNFAETSTISRSFPEEKFERVPSNSKADIYVINTCSVTDSADKKCRQAIKKFISLSPGAFIAVVGCYAQLNPQEISSIPGVDLVLGSNEKFNISDYITGVKEIVITGVNIGDFGKSTGDSFTALLRELVKVPGIERFRISSIEPNLLTDELIELTKINEKILPHFHIPLQSGSDKILGLMRRRYTRDIFALRIKMIMEKLPFPGIGADIIVGFPGESDSDFEDTYSFLEEMPLSYLHVFTFSERPDTIAEKLPAKVLFRDKEKRSKRLIALSQKKNIIFNKLNIGQVTNVLFEKTNNEGLITGFTSNYIRVEYPWESKLAGQIRKVRLNNISPSGKMSIELIG